MAIAIVTLLITSSCEQKETGGIVLNEICGEDSDGLEWIEIGNNSNTPINIKKYKLRKTDVEGLEKKLYVFPDTTLQPGQIYMVNTENLRAHIPYKKPIIVELEDRNGNIIDSFDSMEELELESHPAGTSYARRPNLTGHWTLSSAATWNESNDNATAAPLASDEFDELDME